MGSFSLYENSELVKALANRRLKVCESFDVDVEEANLLVKVLLVLCSPSPIPSPSPFRSPLPSRSSPSARDRMRTHTPTIDAKRAADSSGKSELEICSPQDPIVYLSCRI